MSSKVLSPAHLARAARESRPDNAAWLLSWIWSFTGVKLASRSVCPGHTSPGRIVAEKFLDRPPITLTHGPRGGGKSFTQAIVAHLNCRFGSRHSVRILGGSKAQSEQVYRALKESIRDGQGKLGSDADTLEALLRESAHYRNGSEVQILAASEKSVRGPHVPSLVLDEVDVLDDRLRQDAMGMVLNRPDTPAAVDMLSTWHRVAGPMAGLIEQAGDGAFPLYRFCTFEVLETCPESRSGPRADGPDLYARCPECPLKTWCHEDARPLAPGLPPEPKAKRSAGHVSIETLIQKTVATSPLVFAADYLCRGPKPDGLWFKNFDPDANVRPVEYLPQLPLHLSVDSGVFTGAVLFQAVPVYADRKPDVEVHVLDEYLSEDEGAEQAARSLRELVRSRYGDRIHHASTDSAGDSRNAVGPKVIQLYRQGGLWPLEFWPKYPGSVADSLANLDSLILAADGKRRLFVHPRCKRLIAAFQNYRRARRGGQWQDYPEDPQHPHEDLIDALRGGLMLALPRGRDVAPTGRKVPASKFL